MLLYLFDWILFFIVSFFPFLDWILFFVVSFFPFLFLFLFLVPFTFFLNLIFGILFCTSAPSLLTWCSQERSDKQGSERQPKRYGSTSGSTSGYYRKHLWKCRKKAQIADTLFADRALLCLRVARRERRCQLQKVPWVKSVRHSDNGAELSSPDLPSIAVQSFCSASLVSLESF